MAEPTKVQEYHANKFIVFILFKKLKYPTNTQKYQKFNFNEFFYQNYLLKKQTQLINILSSSYNVLSHLCIYLESRLLGNSK